MRERPILFSAPMLRALLAGTKTQTRRITKGHAALWLTHFEPDYVALPGNHLSPYGYAGDRLWVREAWRAYAAFDKVPPRDITAGVPIWYEAQDDVPFHPTAFGKLRPSMFMPRWASRLLLEVIEVRVERLQDISEADSRAEGIVDGGCTSCGEPEPCGCAAPAPSARDAYCHLWGQINGPDSWAANPWVWAVSFRRID